MDRRSHQTRTAVHTAPKVSERTIIKTAYQLDKYNKFINFEMEARNIFITKSYNIDENEIVPIIMKWLGHEGLIFIQNLNDNEQEMFYSSK